MNIPKLKANEIEVKIKQVTEKGVIALLYKTARVDMAILDEVFGAENWTDDYKEIKDNLYCGIGTRTSKDEQFVWKWDCGIESREDSEGNQKKGEASDAFKRAGFKWGIGRELYTAPFIFIPAEAVPDGKGYKLKDRFAKYKCKEISCDENGDIARLVIVDGKGIEVFSFPQNKGSKKPAVAVDELPKQLKEETLQHNEKIYRCENCNADILPRTDKKQKYWTSAEIFNTYKGYCIECYKKIVEGKNE